MDEIEIRPQPKQELCLSSSADIVIFGGAAGGGKTWALLIEPLRHIHNKDFGAVIFRRTIPEVTKEGGMWDESGKIYPLLDAKPNENEKQYVFPSGSRITFSHLQHEKNLADWRGAQIPLIEFDQLETFDESMFFYMLSRNRSTCGIAPYVRASANPEPGWLADLLSWWIAEDGYANLEKAGIIRWFIRANDAIVWADTREELEMSYPESRPKSMTFIPSTVWDNPILLEKDPGYLANLQALSNVDRERLLGDQKRGGNWKIKPAAGKVFNRDWFEIVDAVPAGGREVRFYDLAATEKKLATDDPDNTASVKMKKVAGIYYVLDCTEEALDPARIDAAIRNRASQDGFSVAIRFEVEGGASGKRDARSIVTMLAGYDVKGIRPQGDKLLRSKPLAAQALAGNVKLLRGSWNERWLNHMHAIPDGKHDDIHDASAGAFNELTGLHKEAGSSQG